MPEMPEVESIVTGIRDKITGRKIDGVMVFEGKENVIKYPSVMQFVHNLTGRIIKDLRRRGKYLILELDSDWLLVIHLRMTGKLIYVTDPTEVDKYSCVQMHLHDGNYLVYGDIRRLGTLDLIKVQELSRIKGLYTLGPEPLSEEFTTKYLLTKTRRDYKKIKTFLLDQKNIAGLGNIYVDEALAISKIHPERISASLTTAEVEALHAAVNQVIGEGIRDGGTSFRDYRNGLNQKGSHQEKLYVYNRAGQPCKFCGTPISKILINGRGTHFCEKCQKAPNVKKG